MTDANVGALAILPIAMWAVVIFAFLPRNTLARLLRETWRANTQEEAIQGARVWAVIGTVSHLTILGVTGLLIGSGNKEAAQILRVHHPLQLGVQGLMFGFALTSLVPLMRVLLPEVRRFPLMTLVGIGPSLPTSFLTLTLFTFVHEAWRVLCLHSLIQSGCTAQMALLLTSVAYGLAFSTAGLSAGASAAALGAVYGALYLWQGYFLLPFVAHLTYEFQIAILSWSAPSSGRPPIVPSPPLATCPACQARIDLRPVGSSPSFRCPQCAAALSVSDDRVAIVRWGGAVFTGLLTYVAFSAFEVTLGFNDSTLWIAYALALPSYWSLVFTLRVLFPPKLQCGDPGFINLGLNRSPHDRSDMRSGTGSTTDEPGNPNP